MFLLTLVSAFDKAKLPYVIVGGYAVALHGVVRGTVDIDLVIRLSLQDFEKAETTLKSLGLLSKIPVTAKDVFMFREEYIQKRNLIAWSFVNPNNPVEIVDIIITQDLRKLRIKEVNVGNISIRILSKEDLILIKKASGRPQDLEDIKALRKL